MVQHLHLKRHLQERHHQVANDHDKVDIFFYKGQDGVDVDIVDVQETIKIGDELKITKSPIGETISQSGERVVKEILGADLVETNIYTGLGVDEINEKPIRWTNKSRFNCKWTNN